MEQAQEWISKARSIAVLTGAGVSAESGIPTFRGSGGFWGEFRPQDMATPEAFARNPTLVWKWYDSRRGELLAARPNPGHRALARLEQRSTHFTLITQNVDDLHEQAGSGNVLHLHGSIWTIRCTACGSERFDKTHPLPELPPRCECGAMLRPGVVWFGEDLDPGIWKKAEESVTAAEAFLVIGTSSEVYPAAGLASLARSAGVKVVELNIERPARVRGHAYIQGPSGEVLPRLIA